MKVTFKDAQNSRLPAAVGACPTDLRFQQLLNESLERLMYEGHWHETTQKVRFCAVDGCITQPPQVATIEKVAVCGQPVTLRTQWHEFMDGGAGIRGSVNSSGSGCCGNNLASGTNEALFRGYSPTFGDITGLNKKVNLVCDLASDIGKSVLVLGYDANLNWIRTNQGGTILDGELIALSQSGGTTSTNFFSSITGIQFNEDRDSQVWLYEYNNDTAIRRMIGHYEAFETRPDYSRYFFPSITSGASSNGNCTQTLVEAMVKLNYWPVKSLNDYLCIPCLPALKEMIQALNVAETEPDGIKKVQIVAAGLVSAKAILNAQLDHFTGSGAIPSLSIVGAGVGEVCPIPILI